MEIGVDLDDLNGSGGLIEDTPQIDKAEELQQVWQVQEGDLWQCGRHRVLCGDCTDRATVDRLMGGDLANVVMTSPPYAMQRKDTYGGVETDKYVDWWNGVQAVVRDILAEDGSFFVNIKPHSKDGQRVLYVFDLVLAMVRQWEWRFVDEFCWRLTTNGMPGKFAPRLKNAFEPIYWFTNGKPTLNEDDIKEDYRHASVKRLKKLSARDLQGRNFSTSQSGFSTDITKFNPLNGALPSNVIELSPDVNPNNIHSASFPTALPTFFIKAYSDPDDIIFDPFLGSGTTMIAAHNEDRIGLGTERLPKYVSVILQRYADLTGETPTKIED